MNDTTLINSPYVTKLKRSNILSTLLTNTTTRTILEVLAALIELLAARGVIDPDDVLKIAEVSARHHGTLQS